MNDEQLTEVLERAAAPVPRPDLAAAALDEARRVRRRRRGAATIATAAAVVVAISVGVSLKDDARPEPAPPAGDGELPTTQVAAIPEEVVAGFWDVPEVAGLPLRNTRLPEAIEQPASAPELAGNPIPAAVLSLWGEGDRVYLRSPDGDWRWVSTPGILPQEATLSDDGARLAVPGEQGLVVWDVADGTSTTLPWPEGVRTPVSEGVLGLRWTPDATRVLVLTPRGSWLLGLEGSVDRRPFPTDRYGTDVFFTDDGRVLELADDLQGTGRFLTEWEGGEPVSSLDATPLDSLGRAAVRGGLVAAVRGDGGWSGPRLTSDWDGLIVLGRDDLTARAYLPIRDQTAAYSEGGLTVHGWLDDETVLAWVRPKVSARRVGEDWWLVAWHFPSGEMTRVAGGDGYTRLTDVVPTLVE